MVNVCPSSMVWSGISDTTGGSFIGFIVMLTVAVLDVAPLLSSTVYVRLSVP